MADQFELGARFSKVEEKVDGLTMSINEIKSVLWKKVNDHDSRLPVVEDRVNDLRRMGWLVVSCIVAQFIGAIAAVIMLKGRGV